MNGLSFLGEHATFDHVGMAVASIRDVAGNDVTVIDDPLQRVSVAFVELGGLNVELIQPLGEGSPIDRTLAKGQVLAHLCFRVPNLETALVHSRRSGFHQLARPVPAVAFGGRRIAWLFAKHVGLIELVEDVVQPSVSAKDAAQPSAAV